MTDIINKLEDFTSAQLAEAYNTVSERKIKRFADSTTAALRTGRALETAGLVAWIDADGAVQTGKKAPRTKIQRRRGLGSMYKDNEKIELRCENPKRKNTLSHARWELMWDGMTVSEYREAVLAAGQKIETVLSDLTYAAERQQLTVWTKELCHELSDGEKCPYWPAD